MLLVWKNARKIENVSPLHVVPENEPSVAVSLHAEQGPQEKPQQETVGKTIKLPKIEKISDLKEEIENLKQKINWTKVYTEDEKHLYKDEEQYVPLVTQLRIRQNEFDARKKKWWFF